MSDRIVDVSAVEIETEWNLELFHSMGEPFDKVVEIETEWNLETPCHHI